MKALRIAYLSESSPTDKHAWSGTVHYVYQALLKGGYIVTPLGPGRPIFARYILAIVNKLSLSITGKRIDYRHSRWYAKEFARLFEKRLNSQEFDLVVHCGTTETGAYLNTKLPVIYILDRTIGGAINYHTILSKLWKFSENQSITVDKLAMEKASLILFSSEWAANHARTNYHIDNLKIKVLPFGANLDSVPSREESLLPKSMDVVQLFLMGTYWQNKGADIAYNSMIELRKKGFRVRLTVAGCQPPEPIADPDLVIIPFIDKNSPEGLQQIWQLFRASHFFILPTRFDCTPIVYCEASAFGVPVLSADTGGVRGHISDGVNGFLLPYEDAGPAYANKIEMLLRNEGEYERLRVSTRKFYEEQLNWESWVTGFSKCIANIL